MILKKITILSKEEFWKYESVIPTIDFCWWLRSPGDLQDRAAYVDYDGYVFEYGDKVNFDFDAIRPALKLDLEISDNRFWYKPEKLIGTKIEYGGYNWTILDAELGELYVLCDEMIARHRFDPKSNNWNKSELKQWLKTEGLKLITN